jgi:carbamoyl-phosphate synthase large subunit
MQLKKQKGLVLATVNNHDKEEFLEIAKELHVMGYAFIATRGTAKLLREEGLKVEEVLKIKDGEPNIIDVIRDRKVDIVINTPTKGNDSHRDGFIIRRAAVEKTIQVVTSLDTMKALIYVSKKLGSSGSPEDTNVFNMGFKQ